MTTLLDSFLNRGVCFRLLDGDEMEIRAPKKLLTPDDRAGIKSRKAELLAELRAKYSEAEEVVRSLFVPLLGYGTITAVQIIAILSHEPDDPSLRRHGERLRSAMVTLAGWDAWPPETAKLGDAIRKVNLSEVKIPD